MEGQLSPSFECFSSATTMMNKRVAQKFRRTASHQQRGNSMKSDKNKVDLEYLDDNNHLSCYMVLVPDSFCTTTNTKEKRRMNEIGNFFDDINAK